MLLSLCMIVRDSASFLQLNLPVLAEYVDEMVIVDTGSVDDTMAYCRSLGARVYEMPWENDFSAPRNEAFRHAKGDWILCLDSDEFMAPEALGVLREWLLSGEADGVAYKCPIYQNKLMELTTQAQFHFRIKLIQNFKGFSYSGRIIEEIVDENGRGFEQVVSLMDMSVYHWGNPHNLNPVEWQAKKDRNIQILEALLSEDPTSGERERYTYQLAVNYMESKVYDKAMVLFNQIMVDSQDNSVKLIEVGIKQARCLLDVGHIEDSQTLCLNLLELDAGRSELWNILGLCSLMKKDFDSAETYFTNSVAQTLPTKTYVDFQVADYTYLNRFYLGLTYFFQQNYARSEHYFRDSIEQGCHGDLLEKARYYLEKSQKEVYQ